MPSGLDGENQGSIWHYLLAVAALVPGHALAAVSYPRLFSDRAFCDLLPWLSARFASPHISPQCIRRLSPSLVTLARCPFLTVCLIRPSLHCLSVFQPYHVWAMFFLYMVMCLRQSALLSSALQCLWPFIWATSTQALISTSCPYTAVQPLLENWLIDLDIVLCSNHVCSGGRHVGPSKLIISEHTCLAKLCKLFALMTTLCSLVFTWMYFNQ